MTELGPTTTTEEILAGSDLNGRHVMITGASSGLGEESARALAGAGAAVTMLGRDPERLAEAVERVGSTVDDADLRSGVVDLADLASVRSYATEYVSTGDPIDVLMNNAGVMACPLLRTADGFEMQFGTNHLGHFVLTNTLMPRILAGSDPRIVNLSSAGHSISDVSLDDPNYERDEYDPWIAYGRSKTANVLFTRELARRYAGRIVALAVHPGAIMTNLGRHLTDELIEQMMQRGRERSEASGESTAGDPFQFKSVEAGAATQVWAATAPELADHSGAYLGDCRLGVEGANPGGNGYLPYIYDDETAAALWTLSEQLVGQEFPALV